MPQICCLFVKGNLRSDVINKHVSNLWVCGSSAPANDDLPVLLSQQGLQKESNKRDNDEMHS